MGFRRAAAGEAGRRIERVDRGFREPQGEMAGAPAESQRVGLLREGEFPIHGPGG